MLYTPIDLEPVVCRLIEFLTFQRPQVVKPILNVTGRVHRSFIRRLGYGVDVLSLVFQSQFQPGVEIDRARSDLKMGSLCP